MPAIRLFGYLRDYAGGGQFEIPGRTVGELLAGLCTGNTRLCSAIFEGEQINRHVRIVLNGRDVEVAQGLATPVAADEVLAVFPPIAGG
jgi:molybdopterin converting factor small subunit